MFLQDEEDEGEVAGRDGSSSEGDVLVEPPKQQRKRLKKLAGGQ